MSLSHSYPYVAVQISFVNVVGIDIEKPSNLDSMGTYTQRLMGDKIRRIQISGPLLMNWYMLLIEKNYSQDTINTA